MELIEPPNEGLLPAASSTLVIGAGFVGRAVAAELLRMGRPVTLLTRTSRATARTPELAGARRVRLASMRSAAVVNLIATHGHVVLAAGGASPAASEGLSAGALHSELELIQLVLAAVRINPDCGLTYLSSGGAVYGDAPVVPTPETCRTNPISDYGYAKLAGEELVRVASEELGMRARILRISNAYGPGQPAAGVQGVIGSAFRCAISGDPLVLVDNGRAIRDFVHIDDIVAVIIGTMHMPDRLNVLNVGSGVGMSVGEIVRMVEQTTGLPVPIEPADARPFDVRVSVLDIAELQRRIAYSPISVDLGLELTWAYLTDTRVRV